MERPAIVAVDDDPRVLRAVARDLQAKYGERYRIVRAESGAAALEALRSLVLRSEPVALLLVDQRMPEMSGIEFMGQALELVPDAKRVLLTAYADTEAAIRAINEVHLDHYLMKPWDPPEERLYPVLDDLLDDWRASYLPDFEGITVIGYRWSAESHAAKDFLVRNLIPYRWLDVEEDEEAGRLLEAAGAPPGEVPVVVFPDGSHLVRPNNVEIAGRVGLRTQAEMRSYDLVIVGAGPAGLAAAVYGASEGLRTLLVEGEAPGGQAGMSSSIENYLGFPSGLSGSDLARRAVAQARRFGAEILTPLEARGMRLQDPFRIISLSDGSEVVCRGMVIATGVSYRKLEVPGVERLTGAGVFYGAAITEALLTKDRDVFIVGGGNSAGQAAMYLSRYARSVTLLVRGSSLAASMSHYLIAQLEANPKVRVRLRSTVKEVLGERSMEGIVLSDLDGGESEELPAAALFVFIGAEPRTEWIDGVVERDPRGFILSGVEAFRDGRRPESWTLKRDPLWLETSVPGVFVAGDVRHRSVKRLASAVGEGAMAVQFIHQHLSGL